MCDIFATGAIANSQSISRRRHIAILRSGFKKSRSNRAPDSEFFHECKAKFFVEGCAGGWNNEIARYPLVVLLD